MLAGSILCCVKYLFLPVLVPCYIIIISTGGDYISHFYKTSKFIEHVLNDGGLINMTSANEGSYISSIKEWEYSNCRESQDLLKSIVSVKGVDVGYDSCKAGCIIIECAC